MTSCRLLLCIFFLFYYYCHGNSRRTEESVAAFIAAQRTIGVSVRASRQYLCSPCVHQLAAALISLWRKMPQDVKSEKCVCVRFFLSFHFDFIRVVAVVYRRPFTIRRTQKWGCSSRGTRVTNEWLAQSSHCNAYTTGDRELGLCRSKQHEIKKWMKCEWRTTVGVELEC